jgi:dipeptidyl aminopeptidase/acylaminoacyl peptidase
VQYSLSPDQRTVAFIVDTAPEDDLAGLELQLLTLPDGEPRTVAALQNPGFSPDLSADPPIDTWEAMIAIVWSTLAWSPEGSRIAFVGQIEGPSADLYVISLPTREVIRLTDGLSQAYDPSWSPDGRRIFHSAVWSFGTGAGASYAGSWVARANGSGLVQLPGLSHYQDELLRWLSNTQILLASWSQPCGDGHLRIYDATTSAATELWPYYYEDFASDPASGRIVITVPSSFSGFCTDPPQPTGIFLLDSSTRRTTRVTQTSSESDRVVSHPSLRDHFLLVSESTLYQLLPTGALVEQPGAPPAFPAPSPAGDIWAWENASWQEPGLWVGPALDMHPPRVSSQYSFNLTWEPHGLAFFFVDIDARTVYFARAPDFEPRMVTPDIAIHLPFGGITMASPPS